MAQYSHIMDAIRKTEGLTPAERVENYNILERLNAEGRKLSDILKQAEGAQKVEDVEVFSIMEAEVKDDTEVKGARKRLADTKTEIIAKMCYQHPEYRQAVGDYQKAVKEAYMRRREGPKAEVGPSQSVRSPGEKELNPGTGQCVPKPAKEHGADMI